MDNKIFINEAIDFGIKGYLQLKDNYIPKLRDSFFVAVIDALVYLYGELDIINPYIVHSDKAFAQNIMKYGLDKDIYNNFLDQFLYSYKLESINDEQKNKYYTETNKRLIDMFVSKKDGLTISDEDKKEFISILKYVNTELDQYFSSLLQKKLAKPEKEIKNNILNIEAYEVLNYSLTDIANMDSESLDEINKHVYDFFEIDANCENKKELLNQAIQNYKKYNIKLTSGNGYVDILLIMGIIITVIMILLIITFLIL